MQIVFMRVYVYDLYLCDFQRTLNIHVIGLQRRAGRSDRRGRFWAGRGSTPAVSQSPPPKKTLKVASQEAQFSAI